MEPLTDSQSWIAPATLRELERVLGMPVRLHTPYAAKPEPSRPAPSGTGA
jgi:hypothetical protein